jgi:two-component system, LuxR family, sensor kinase FixL
VADVCRLMGIEASERHVAMSLELAPDLPKIAGDRVHLHQVLMNVMLNAFDAMSQVPEPMRSLVVRIERGERDCVDIAVVDSGPGIAAEDLHRLFDPFWTTKQRGIGVGLAISRTIVEAHGGKIWAENGTDGGAVFRIRLPAVDSCAA